MSDHRIYVPGYARTPFGRFGGALKSVGLPQLGAVAVVAALERAEVGPDSVDELAFGVNFGTGDRSIARQVQLRAGIPEDRASFTVDRACCSSLAAITLASRGLRLGDTRVAIAGGVENLSRVPYYIEEARFGRRLGDITLSDRLIVCCPHTGVPRAIQAANEAHLYGIGRIEQDEWACRSQEAYAAAEAKGYFFDEIVPISFTLADGSNVALDRDEPPRPGTTREILAKLETVNGSSTITAGNAPDLSSGATALVLTSVVSESDSSLVGRLEGWSMVGGEPGSIASMPALAAQMALRQTGLSINDIDVIEINEAFAAVPLVATLLLADGDLNLARKIRNRTNTCGGSVAIGHPTGATAARLVMTTINQLRRRGGGTGLVSICGGVGEAEALIVRMGDHS